MVLVSLLIGWKNGARTLNQSLSEVMQNQSNLLITFGHSIENRFFDSDSDNDVDVDVDEATYIF